jgi:hypothetical protein
VLPGFYSVYLLYVCCCFFSVQNEALNGGGTLFVNKHPDLRVRVVHGNTLTAAVILNEIPSNVKEVFLTGATSKLGRAIALYLCRKKIRVLVIHLAPCVIMSNTMQCKEGFVGNYLLLPNVTYRC